MSLWTRITEALAALAKGEGLSAVFDRLRAPPERSVAFTIAVIALSAKMAKADGRVTRDEVTAFRQVFHIPAEEERAAARRFSTWRARTWRGSRNTPRGSRGCSGPRASPAARDSVLCDLMEGLFHIATADGDYHPAEDAFLARVSEIFGLDEAGFRRNPRTLGSRMRRPTRGRCWASRPYAPLEEARAAWKAEVRATHPDRMLARGVPEEAVKLAERRLIAVNRAWEEISARAAESA